jgi:hypothetical protein
MLVHGKAILQRHGWSKDALKEESYFVPTAVPRPRPQMQHATS